MEQRGDGAASYVHHCRGLFLLVPEAVDEDHGHALTVGQASDCRCDIDGDRRIGREKGDHRVIWPMSLMTSLMAEILERPAGRDAAKPGLELRLVAQLGLPLAGMEDRLLRDVLRAGAGTERTAQGREVCEEPVVVNIESLAYPHEYVGSLHLL
jgi:hypothetical protein